jgi:hypothetical protein
MGWASDIRFPAGARDFSLLHSIQTASEAHPNFYSMGTGGLFPGSRRLWHETDHTFPSSVEVKNGGSIPSFPHTSSWREEVKLFLYLTN